ncbi:MAG: hypothetical protein QM811_00715 [Pirellulales bacterium]
MSKSASLLAGLVFWISSAPAQSPAPPRVVPPALRETPADRLRRLTDAKAEETKKLIGEGQTLIVRAPFIVAGDLNEAKLVAYYDNLIAPSAAALGRQFFTHAPDVPIVVWLFSDAKPYAAEAERLYGDKNVSVYGYYKPDKRALVMNIGTGGGTLVHELTHALAAFDFPGQPDWFNEGLASLYEASSFIGRGEELRIRGHVNWRLPRLQEAVAAEKVPTLAELMSDRDFRGANMGRNYAQARYFCLYLQEQGKLEEFYKRFREDRLNDPTGLRAAQRTLGETAWKTLDADYRKWVTELKRER